MHKLIKIILHTFLFQLFFLFKYYFNPILITIYFSVKLINKMLGCCDVVLDQEEFANMSEAIQFSSERPTFRKHLKLLTEEISRFFGV